MKHNRNKKAIYV